jgi:hypothetical protein
MGMELLHLPLTIQPAVEATANHSLPRVRDTVSVTLLVHLLHTVSSKLQKEGLARVVEFPRPVALLVWGVAEMMKRSFSPFCTVFIT